VSKRFHDRYQLGRYLGEGASGHVREAICHSTGAMCAVKVLESRTSENSSSECCTSSTEMIAIIKHEVRIWKLSCDDDHVVKLWETFFEPHTYYLIMERCGPTVMDTLKATPFVDEALLGDTLREMLLGIVHLHQRKIVHRDIKPDNFLYGGPNNEVIKLCDFGLSEIMPEVGFLSGICGTDPYMSPEMVGHQKYTYKTDVWSLGASSYIMLYGDYPYMPAFERNRKTLRSCIAYGHPKPIFQTRRHLQHLTRSAEATSFCQSLLERHPDDRLTSEQCALMSFAFFAKEGADEVRRSRRIGRESSSPSKRGEKEEHPCTHQNPVLLGSKTTASMASNKDAPSLPITTKAEKVSQEVGEGLSSPGDASQRSLLEVKSPILTPEKRNTGFSAPKRTDGSDRSKSSSTALVTRAPSPSLAVGGGAVGDGTRRKTSPITPSWSVTGCAGVVGPLGATSRQQTVAASAHASAPGKHCEEGDGVDDIIENDQVVCQKLPRQAIAENHMLKRQMIRCDAPKSPSISPPISPTPKNRI